MGILIAMPRTPKDEASSRRPLSADGAQIVFFTGVRYERYDEKPFAPQKQSGPGRSRQRRRRA